MCVPDDVWNALRSELRMPSARGPSTIILYIHRPKSRTQEPFKSPEIHHTAACQCQQALLLLALPLKEHPVMTLNAEYTPSIVLEALI